MRADASIDEVAGVVLAGGEGRRFKGKHKPIAELDGKPLVEHVVGTLDDVFSTVPTVVVKSEPQRLVIEESLDTDARFVYDDAEFNGPVSGLLGALDSTYLDWLFVCGCDMPHITEVSIRWLWEQKRGEEDALVPVDSEGYSQTLHSLYKRHSVNRVKGVLGSNDSLRDILDPLPETRRIEVDEERVERAMMSINTRKGLQDV